MKLGSSSFIPLRLRTRCTKFASAREAAGTGRDELPGATVGDVMAAARERYGVAFADVLATCRIWVNGEPAGTESLVGPRDEVAILPPVSGGTW